MRAPGFAVLALGAVVALSGVLGLSYRRPSSVVSFSVTKFRSGLVTITSALSMIMPVLLP